MPPARPLSRRRPPIPRARRPNRERPLDRLEEAHTALTFLYHDVIALDLGELPFPDPPRLLDRLRRACRVRLFSPRTEDCYADWAERFIRFHQMRHPNTRGVPEIEQFLTDLAVNSHVSASTQNQAFFALLFLYQQVLGIDLPRIDALRARRPRRLPIVLSVEEVRRFLDAVQGNDGLFRLMTRLLYGTGLRREECCQVRIHDVDLTRHQLTVRRGKGGKDRVVMLPRSLEPDLKHHLEKRRCEHADDLARGEAYAQLPFALARKFPRAAQEFGWQFVFAARRCCRDPKTGNIGRMHVNPGMLDVGADRLWVTFPHPEKAMTQRKLSRNAPCPCGSGKKYEHCCLSKGFDWIEDEQGHPFRAVPLSAEAAAVLEQQQQKFRQRFGREASPEDLLFFDAPPLEQVEHQIVEAMRRAGLDPAFIHAFEKTGLLVSADNRHLIAEKDLQEWDAAVADYRRRHHAEG
jgi:integron integrase